MPRSRTRLRPRGGWPTLREALEIAYNADTLKDYARVLGIKGPTRKADLARALAREVLGEDLSGPRLPRMFERLDRLQQAAVAEVIHGWGGLDPERFRAKYRGLPRWDGDREVAWRREPTLLGLFLVRDYDPRSGWPTVPLDLAEQLRELVPPPPREEVRTHDDPVPLFDGEPLRVVETERAAQQELFAVLRLVDQGKVIVSDRTRRPSAKTVRAVTEVLCGGDFYGPDEQTTEWGAEIGAIRPFAWPLLIQGARLARRSGKKLALTRAGRKALTQPAADTLRLAWQRWLDVTFLDEFNRVEVIKGQTNRKRMTAVAGRRMVIDEVLSECPAGAWITVDELSRHMQATGATFEVTHNPWKLYIEDAHYGSLGYDGYGGWSILQGRYLMALLFEYAATLGLVDVAYGSPDGARDDFRHQWGTDELEFLSRYDGLSCFRINALGAYVLGIAERYEPPAAEPVSGLRVLANLDVVATGGLFEAGDEAMLESFCERRSDAVFVLDRDRALAAAEKGHHVADLRAFLERASGDPLPETAAAFLDDLDRRARMLHPAGHGLLIECDDPATAALIANDSRTGKLCLLAGDRTLVVPAPSETAFRRAVRALGFPLPPQGPAGG